ncbi:hypothetical protein [Acidiferrobacter thiooxydans]|uniref:Uncharacterized protein n=1 Tax=Acidiferrobacter thiooxydans TaxID=163359 RepID=A0A1C2G095_9GAMM|nr:hypothetical protein [Acidiferrobacter thiooxydans]MDA8190279.1 hypothetical protein [Gammaproteobacteria bacterium]RCN56848.1 hypothetical protein C4900_13955 [Acidiferrobacter thiooxydans]UEN99532.1 hypothetical protein A9R16_014085 [Acidiferrobacter thiooxydans]
MIARDHAPAVLANGRSLTARAHRGGVGKAEPLGRAGRRQGAGYRVAAQAGGEVAIRRFRLSMAIIASGRSIPSRIGRWPMCKPT